MNKKVCGKTYCEDKNALYGKCYCNLSSDCDYLAD